MKTPHSIFMPNLMPTDPNCCYTPPNDFSHKRGIKNFWGDKNTFIDNCDILFIDSCSPDLVTDLRTFINSGKHILAPHLLGLNSVDLAEIFALSQTAGVLFVAAPPFLNLNTYVKLINIALSGAIGTVLGVELSMTYAQAPTDLKLLMRHLGSICLLPVFQLLGWKILQSYQQSYEDVSGMFVVLNMFTNEGFARVKFSKDINMECRCIIQGTRGYIKVPFPWWDSDYFELRYSSGKIKKFSWPASGKAIRYQFADFVKTLFANNYHINKQDGNIMQQILNLDRATENIFKLYQQ